MVNQSEACVEGVVDPVHLHAHDVILEFFPGFTGPPSKNTTQINILLQLSRKLYYI